MTKGSGDRSVHGEQRSPNPRHQRRLLVDIEHEAARLSAYTQNISLGGLFVETNTALPSDCQVLLRFSVPTQREPIEVRGQVRWCEKRGNVQGLGIRFEGLRPRDVWALNRYFEQSSDKDSPSDKEPPTDKPSPVEL
jgi:uncharacterized protein (TIGR02266 family)